VQSNEAMQAHRLREVQATKTNITSMLVSPKAHTTASFAANIHSDWRRSSAALPNLLHCILVQRRRKGTQVSQAARPHPTSTRSPAPTRLPLPAPMPLSLVLHGILLLLLLLLVLLLL
jgi:hypothetical protein